MLFQDTTILLRLLVVLLLGILPKKPKHHETNVTLNHQEQAHEIGSLGAQHQEMILLVLPQQLGVQVMDQDPTVLGTVQTQNKDCPCPKQLTF